ncbi:MAG: AMP-binding protein [Alphaproteobacteria bacterium]|nr:AMP-binding protein [Alphaproteobacteria bacterium]MBR4806588.1 AMP-binding protein [Alphaproteobacteria bacterium]
MNMYQLLESTAKKFPDILYLVREEVTYTGFIDLVKRRAATLHDAGVKSGDVVGILSHNIPAFPITLFAIWYLGGKVLLLDTNLTPFEYDNMAQITKCKFVCAEKSFFYKTDNFTFIDITAEDGDVNQKLKPAELPDSEIATLSFTSGSTGTPKVVPLTHYNLTECAKSLLDMKQWISSGDILYGFLPMYHVFGFAVEVLATVQYGAGVLLQPTINPKELMADFKKYRPHVIPAVPRLFEVFRNKIIDGIKAKHKWFLFSFIIKHQKFLSKIGLGKLVDKVKQPVLDIFGGRAKLLVAGGAATKPEIENFFVSLGLGFIQGYGMTETVGPICISKPCKGRVPFAFGGPTTNNTVEIRDKNADGVGILWLKGNQVFGGYMNNEEANKGAFDERGFFNTGDMVSMDKNGELHFAGRKKQVIVLDSGKNVYPDELEGLFITIPGVKNVAVFEHKIKDKTVSYGVFSVEEGMTMEKLAAAVAAANKKVASYKWVTHFAMTTDDLPMTSTQKVKHHIVRKNLIEGQYPIRKE